MGRGSNDCVIPSCDRHVIPEEGDDYSQGIIIRQMCGRCYASRAYWKKREGDSPGAVEYRQEKLKFFSSRLSWLYNKGSLDE